MKLRKSLAGLLILTIMFLTCLAGTAGCTYVCAEEINAEELAKELSSQGWVMYGTERCPWCIKQKEEFSDAFRYINYVDCEENRQACIDAGIKGIPCWISPNGTLHSGYHNLTKLAQLASAYRAAQPTPTVTPTLSASPSPSPSITVPPTPTPPRFTASVAFAITTLLAIYLVKRKSMR
jgi:hypothetical protein